jgi:hypothetical protein
MLIYIYICGLSVAFVIDTNVERTCAQNNGDENDDDNGIEQFSAPGN